MKRYRIKHQTSGEFWSNDAGWVDEAYDTFSHVEYMQYRLPIGGLWDEIGDTQDDTPK